MYKRCGWKRNNHQIWLEKSEKALERSGYLQRVLEDKECARKLGGGQGRMFAIRVNLHCLHEGNYQTAKISTGHFFQIIFSIKESIVCNSIVLSLVILP